MRFFWSSLLKRSMLSFRRPAVRMYSLRKDLWTTRLPSATFEIAQRKLRRQPCKRQWHQCRTSSTSCQRCENTATAATTTASATASTAAANAAAATAKEFQSANCRSSAARTW